MRWPKWIGRMPQWTNFVEFDRNIMATDFMKKKKLYDYPGEWISPEPLIPNIILHDKKNPVNFT